MSAGALHGLTLLLRVLSGPGDRVVVEHPTYAAALDAVRAVGARPVPVPMLDDGWDLEMLASTFRQAAPGAGVPDRRPPEPDRSVDAGRPTASGWSLWRARRGRRWSSTRRSSACTSTAARRQRSVAAFDEAGETVITIGSMSKTFWAGLRIGWVRANPSLIQRLAAGPRRAWTSRAR